MNVIKVKIDSFINYLIIFFPIYIILGPLMMNLFSLLMSAYVFLYLKEFKKILLSNEKFFLLIIFFVFFIFPYNSINFENSLIKYVSQLRYILMFFGIIIFLNNTNSEKLLNKTKKFYLILLIIISIDVLKEYFTGKNFLGYNTSYTGRIASFTNDELIIGYIFSFLVLFSFGIFDFKINKKYILLFFYILFIISFLIGERSNFFKLLIIIIFFSSLHYFIKYKFTLFKLFKSFLIIFLLTLTFWIVLKNTEQAKKIYNLPVSILNNYSKDLPISHNFYETKHAPHYLTAIKIFSNYPFFGIGIDNYKEESKKKKYENNKLKFSKFRSSTHPHQIHLEILSEVGIIGFFYLSIIFTWSFIIGIKSYFKNFNLHLLGHLMLHVFFIFPILPTGSFFGTIYGMPFWFNLSILIYLSKRIEIKSFLKNI